MQGCGCAGDQWGGHTQPALVTGLRSGAASLGTVQMFSVCCSGSRPLCVIMTICTVAIDHSYCDQGVSPEGSADPSLAGNIVGAQAEAGEGPAVPLSPENTVSEAGVSSEAVGAGSRLSYSI